METVRNTRLGGGFKCLLFSSNIFQMGWNHRLVQDEKLFGNRRTIALFVIIERSISSWWRNLTSFWRGFAQLKPWLERKLYRCMPRWRIQQEGDWSSGMRFHLGSRRIPCACYEVFKTSSNFVWSHVPNPHAWWPFGFWAWWHAGTTRSTGWTWAACCSLKPA